MEARRRLVEGGDATLDGPEELLSNTGPVSDEESLLNATIKKKKGSKKRKEPVVPSFLGENTGPSGLSPVNTISLALQRCHRRLGTSRCVAVAAIIFLLLSALVYAIYFYSLDVKSVEVELMTCTHKIFARHNITYFFDYGSLLGAIRHKAFIPWDDQMDIDIGVLASQTHLINSVKQEFIDENCGYMIHRSDVAHLPGITSFVIKRGAFRIFYHRFIPMFIDIADYEEVGSEKGDDGEEVIIYKDTHHPDLPISFSAKRLLPPSACEFEGRMFNCPHDPGYVLEREFGKDWRTPKKDFKPEHVTEENRVYE